MACTFTYDFESNPLIAYVRLLIPDTNEAKKIFCDEEIEAFYNIQQQVFQSSMFFSGREGRYLPQTPVSYVRVAALALDTLANNKGKLGAVVQLLDVKLDPTRAASVLRDGAENYRKIDDDAGAMVIIEQTNTQWSFEDRWWKQWQRQSAGAGLIG
jgi:hypothetical protein